VGVDEVLRSVVHEYVLARARVFILEFRRLSYTILLLLRGHVRGC